METVNKSITIETDIMKDFYEGKCEKCGSERISINLKNPGLQTCLNFGNVMTIKHKK